MRKQFGIYLISDILPLISSDWGAKADLMGFQVNVHSVRLRTFATKGCVCVKCGLEGSYFSLELLDPKSASPHLNLYGMKDGKEVLFTKDHIFPASKGGRDTLKNLQTMCTECNLEKGSDVYADCTE